MVAAAEELNMVAILLFLATKCAFLFTPNGYRFVDSQVGTSFGGDAYVILESNVVRLIFAWDRSQLLLEFQPVGGKARERFSLDLLKGVLTGVRGGSSLLDDDSAEFLGEHLAQLEACFADPERREETLTGLRQQARQRMKQLDSPRRKR